MAISHARSGEAIDVRPLGADLSSQQSVALFKSEDLEVMRLVLPAGKSLPPHRVAGEMTIQCIEGLIDVTVDDESHPLGPGQLLYLSGGVRHGVVALDHAQALLTVVVRK